MTVPHYIAGLKIATLVGSIVGAAIWAMEPNVKVALIVATPGTITGVGMLVLQWLTRRDHIRDTAISLANQAEMKQDQQVVLHRVDGINTRLQDRNEAQGIELKAAHKEADHAAGKQQERTEERDRNAP